MPEGGLGLVNMQTFIPYLNTNQIDCLFKDDCNMIALLVNKENLQWMMRMYLGMLHPLLVDKKLIADYWWQS